MRRIDEFRRLFKTAKRFIPGGVNSPVRSFKAVGGSPIFMKGGRDAKIYDEVGRSYVDYCLCWGVLILGHSHPKVVRAITEASKKSIALGTATRKEIELAQAIVEAIDSIEQVRLVNSGTEAVMSAIRVARAFTGREKIIKFEGSYHGHSDYLLVKAGSGGITFGRPDSSGVPQDFVRSTIVLPYNDLRRLREAVKRFKNELACVIVEPVIANCGVILPRQNFLEELRLLADKYGYLLIFDEVITGFRVSYRGAQGFFGIKPDITCLGKIIGGGLPIGAFGARREIMKLLAPDGSVYQAGTLSGNPICVSAGLKTLEILKKEDPYEALNKKTEYLCEKIRELALRFDIPLKINRIASIFSLFFTDREVYDYKTALTQDKVLFNKFYTSMLEEGIYFSPSGFEANFVSVAHSENGDIAKTIRAVKKTFAKMSHYR